MADVKINFRTAGDEVVIGALRQVGSAAVNFLGAAAAAAADFAKDSFAGALEAQKGIDTLTATIGRLGAKTPVTMQGALALADQFKNLVGGSDDAVLAMVNMGLRFDKIGQETFPRFIQSSADLATTLNIDSTKAAELLGKTLQDLSTDGTASIGRLKAAGVALTDQQEAQIQKMVETGDVAGAQKVLLDALAATTGGAAAAAAGTAAGQWDIFKESIADAGEGVMLELMPVLNELTATVLPALMPVIQAVAEAATQFITNTLVPAFQDAVAWFRANWPQIQATITDVWNQAQPILQALISFIQNTVVPAIAAAVQWVVTNWPQIQATIQRVMTQVQTVITTILGAIQVFWDTWGATIMGILQFYFDQFKSIWDIFAAAFRGDWREFGEQLRVAFDRAWSAIKEIAALALNWFKTQDWGQIGKDIVRGIANGISAAAQWIQDAALAAARAAVEAVKGFLGIRSPSKVFAGVGANMMAGMAQGIMGSTGMPVRAATGAASQAMSAVTNNSGGNTYNYYGVQADMRAAYDRAMAGAF